ncbi:DUF2891 family protein [Ornithinimicrobium ciconiae]|uniref:DUF2891 family protein n=1 Tax=Ornithinimicrobium ciconiae TaxID=2594265 RepID=UPI0038994881
MPGLGEGAHAHLLEPPSVLDTTDGQGAHLLGLSLSRAWQLRTLARSLGGGGGGAGAPTYCTGLLTPRWRPCCPRWRGLHGDPLAGELPAPGAAVG